MGLPIIQETLANPYISLIKDTRPADGLEQDAKVSVQSLSFVSSGAICSAKNSSVENVGSKGLGLKDCFG